MNIEVIGISRDHAASQGKFKETVNAKNTFLSDQDAKIISAYGALSAQRVANRYYFLIDESGKLIEVKKEPQKAQDAQSILCFLCLLWFLPL